MDAITPAVEAVQSAASALPRLAPASEPVAGRFEQWIGHEIGALDTQLRTAERSVQQLAAGSAANLHDVMIQLEQARLALQLAVQVRSRVVEAYQDILRMQV